MAEITDEDMQLAEMLVNDPKYDTVEHEAWRSLRKSIAQLSADRFAAGLAACENCKKMEGALTQVARENRSLEKRCVSAQGDGVDAIAAAELRGQAAMAERAAEAVEVFDDWRNCECSECRSDARSHAVDTSASIVALGQEVRALSPDPGYTAKVREEERKRIISQLSELSPIDAQWLEQFPEDRAYARADVIAAIEREG